MADRKTLIDRAIGPGGSNTTIGRAISSAAGAIHKGFVHDPAEEKIKERQSVDLHSTTNSPTRDKGPAPSGRAGFDQSQLSTIPKPASGIVTPQVNANRMNMGGGPGQESPGAGMVRDSFTGEHAQLFAKPESAGPRPGLKDGVYLPMGGFGTGGMVNVGDVGSKQAGALFGAKNPDFTGQPSMYPAQQSVGRDIFGDTADLFRQRDSLRAQRDAFFARNPLSPTDIGGNFAKAAMMSGNRKDLEELNKTLNQREQIMGTLAGIMMQGQNQMGVQGLENAGNERVANINGQNQMQNQLFQNRGNMDVVRQQGINQLGAIDLQTKGMLQATDKEIAGRHVDTFMTESGADRRASEKNALDRELAKYKGMSEKELYGTYTEFMKIAADTEKDPEARKDAKARMRHLESVLPGLGIKGRSMPDPFQSNR